MNPKPQAPYTKRLDRKRKVTFIAALPCEGAILFASDSEESGVVRKSRVQKISSTDPNSLIKTILGDTTTALVVARAGNGTMCDYASERILDECEHIVEYRAVRAKIESILVDIWDNKVPRHPADDPRETDFELLIGAKSPDWPYPILYSTQGTTVVRREKYFVCGSGSVVDYILDKGYSQYMSVEDATVLCIYMLQIAKEYVSGVSGKTRITTLNDKGDIDSKPYTEVSEEENILSQLAICTDALMLSTLRTRSGTDDDFKSTLKWFNKQVEQLRQKKKDILLIG